MSSMNTIRLWCLLALAGILPALSACSAQTSASSQDSQSVSLSAPAPQLPPMAVTQLEATRLSRSQIQLSWPDGTDPDVASYTLKKRPAASAAGDWTTVAVVQSDLQATGAPVQVTDTLADTAIQQYEYTVDVTVLDPAMHSAGAGARTLASNFLVCIDPGHYGGDNAIPGERSYGYAEGDVTLALGLALQETLKTTYGIDSYLTRDTDSITMDGYTDAALDSAHISLRGLYADEHRSDLFLSLHTNANLNNANGHPTLLQPIGMNKPILIISTTARSSPFALDVANAIGSNLAQTNAQLGLATVAAFQPASWDQIEHWSDARNDAMGQPGSVFIRLGAGDRDYYGILRGSSAISVPGIIVEHGMHTVPEVRQAAMEGDLIAHWAEADAKGIAEGLGLSAVASVP